MVQVAPFTTQPKKISDIQISPSSWNLFVQLTLSALFLYDMLFQLFWIEATERNVSGWQRMETGALQLKTVKSAIQKQKIASKLFSKGYCMQIFKGYTQFDKRKQFAMGHVNRK